jgi:hypothetical protein
MVRLEEPGQARRPPQAPGQGNPSSTGICSYSLGSGGNGLFGRTTPFERSATVGAPIIAGVNHSVEPAGTKQSLRSRSTEENSRPRHAPYDDDAGIYTLTEVSRRQSVTGLAF